MTDHEARVILRAAEDDGRFLPWNPWKSDIAGWDIPKDAEPKICLDDYYTLSELLAILHFAPKDSE